MATPDAAPAAAAEAALWGSLRTPVSLPERAHAPEAAASDESARASADGDDLLSEQRRRGEHAQREARDGGEPNGEVDGEVGVDIDDEEEEEDAYEGEYEDEDAEDADDFVLADDEEETTGSESGGEGSEPHESPAWSRIVDLDSGMTLSIADVDLMYEARDLDSGARHSLVALSAREGVVLDGRPLSRRQSSSLRRRRSQRARVSTASSEGADAELEPPLAAARSRRPSAGCEELCSGWLLKRGRRTSAWKQLWCRITSDGWLQVYASAPEARVRGAARSSKLDISLRGAVLRLALPDDQAEAEWRLIAAAVSAAAARAPTSFDLARVPLRGTRRLSQAATTLSLEARAPADGPRRANSVATLTGAAQRSARRDARMLFGFVIAWYVPAAPPRRAGLKQLSPPNLSGPAYEERVFYCTGAHELDRWLRFLALYAACQTSLRIGAASPHLDGPPPEPQSPLPRATLSPRPPGGAISEAVLAASSAAGTPVSAEGSAVSMTDQHGFVLTESEASSFAAWLHRRPRHSGVSESALAAERGWQRWLAGGERAGLSAEPPPPPDWLVWRGVPPCLRVRVWLRASGAQRYLHRLPGYYDVLCAKAVHVVPRCVASEVERDLHRTYPRHPHFATDESLGRAALRRVLLAFALHCPRVGYCQALNYVCAMLLVATSFDEECSFWLLSCLVERLAPDFYSYQMEGICAQQESFNRLLVAILPQLAAHIEEVGMPTSFVTTPWFMSLFATSLPSETVLRVWDVLLFDGPLVLSLVGAALMKFGAKQLMAASTMHEVAELLSALGREEWDADALLGAACFRGADKAQRALLDAMRKHNREHLTEVRAKEIASVTGLV